MCLQPHTEEGISYQVTNRLVTSFIQDTMHQHGRLGARRLTRPGAGFVLVGEVDHGDNGDMVGEVEISDISNQQVEMRSGATCDSSAAHTYCNDSGKPSSLLAAEVR